MCVGANMWVQICVCQVHMWRSNGHLEYCPYFRQGLLLLVPVHTRTAEVYYSDCSAVSTSHLLLGAQTLTPSFPQIMGIWIQIPILTWQALSTEPFLHPFPIILINIIPVIWQDLAHLPSSLLVFTTTRKNPQYRIELCFEVPLCIEYFD